MGYYQMIAKLQNASCDNSVAPDARRIAINIYQAMMASARDATGAKKAFERAENFVADWGI